jgi:hypothetical protein
MEKQRFSPSKKKPSRGQAIKHPDGYITVISEIQRVHGEPATIRVRKLLLFKVPIEGLYEHFNGVITG